jgi:F-type H+-transporting ATPase subunit b
MLVASTNFLIPNWTFVADLIIFLIVMWVMAKLVLPKVSRAAEDRAANIRAEMQRAEAARAEGELATRERQAVLAKARTEARALIDEATRQADELRTEARTGAQEEYSALLATSDQSIEAERAAARRDLLTDLPSLVVAAAEQVIRSEIDPGRHEAVIAGALASARALASQPGGEL